MFRNVTNIYNVTNNRILENRCRHNCSVIYHFTAIYDSVNIFVLFSVTMIPFLSPLDYHKIHFLWAFEQFSPQFIPFRLSQNSSFVGENRSPNLALTSRRYCKYSEMDIWFFAKFERNLIVCINFRLILIEIKFS